MSVSPQCAVLRQLANSAQASDVLHPLIGTGEVLIGRDPRCQILLDSIQHAGVSRHHARICPTVDWAGWQICDLSSANGTFINGVPLVGCQRLRSGDRIVLGNHGPQFIFELRSAGVSLSAIVPTHPTPALPPLAQPTTHPPAWEVPSHPPAASASGSDAVSLSQLFPILSAGDDLKHKAYLVPTGLTVCFVILLFFSVGNSALFNGVLATYIAGAAYLFVYQLCGKHKPWWILVAAGLMTIGLLLSPVLDLFILVFREVLPGDIPTEATGATGNFFSLLGQMFFGAGLMEELLKALPVLLIAGLATRLRSPLREQVGVWEPLDGILLGAASAVGFTVLETLGEYVPTIISHTTLQAGEGAGQLAGLQLLIPRLLGSIAGHIAYSGYLGYCIGLSALKPSKRWRILAVGYMTASGLHALWNASGLVNFLTLALVGILSYAFLAAAILKARTLSPTRSQNFATRFFS